MSQASAFALIREGWELHARQADPDQPAADHSAGAPDHPAGGPDHLAADDPAAGDPDLALLLGDRLYASGLLELVRLDDLPAVRRMADVISECARALAEREPERAERSWAHLPTG